MRFWTTLCVLLASSTRVHANPDDLDDDVVVAPRDHAGQFGLSLGVAVGFRAIATYDAADYCGDTSRDTASGYAPTCLGRTPMALDLTASYGFAPNREAILETRIGVEHDFGASPSTDGPRLLHLAPGLRFFFSDARTSKLFSTVQLVLDLAGYDDASGESRGADVGFRNLNGLWFDPHARYGYGIFVGETLSFSRWIGFGLEAGIMVGGRLP